MVCFARRLGDVKAVERWDREQVVLAAVRAESELQCLVTRPLKEFSETKAFLDAFVDGPRLRRPISGPRSVLLRAGPDALQKVSDLVKLLMWGR